ncbi:MAG: ribonuclease J [Rickettsiales bacterium]|jgi:ribonuclease J|nr:ribonuclease J [Rickettsiales bacterium]
MVKVRKENQIADLPFLSNGDEWNDDKEVAIKATSKAVSRKPKADEEKHQTKNKKSGNKKPATNNQPPATGDPSDTLFFFALGGLEHVGQNMYVYKYRGKYIVVDAGIGFLEAELEGADTKYPDTSWLEKHKADVLAFIITHGHEDHTGALKYVWPKFNCPIYCTEFVEKFSRKTLEGVGIAVKSGDFVRMDKNGGNFKIGPFEIENFHVTHSVPEAQMIVIKTAQGKVLHTGDWTFNDDNPIEPNTDYARLREIGSDPDLLAVVGDSTEISRTPPQTTEMEVCETFKNLFARAPGRVLIAGYSRSIARLKMVSLAAQAVGRVACIKERSNPKPVPYVGLPEFREIGIELGYLQPNDLTTFGEISHLPAEKQAIFLTGSQGEEYSMLWRLCRGQVKEMKLMPTDTVIFSAIVIPGRERDVSEMYNRLAKLGIHFHTIFDTEKLHANGHAGYPEYERFYDMVHPQTIIPMHGEYMSEMMHAKIAMERGGAKHMMVVKNGEVVALRRNEAPYVAETIPTGYIVLEGDVERSGKDAVFKNRKNMLLHGAVFVTLPVDKRGFLKGAPEVSSSGIFETDTTGFMKRQIQIEVTKAIDDMSKTDRKNQKNLSEATRAAVMRAIRPQLGRDKSPNVITHFVMK